MLTVYVNGHAQELAADWLRPETSPRDRMSPTGGWVLGGVYDAEGNEVPTLLVSPAGTVLATDGYILPFSAPSNTAPTIPRGTPVSPGRVPQVGDPGVRPQSARLAQRAAERAAAEMAALAAVVGPGVARPDETIVEPGA